MPLDKSSGLKRNVRNMDTKTNFSLVGGLPKLTKETVMIEITRGTVANGETVAIGEVIEVVPEDAVFLISINKAKRATEKPKRRRRVQRTVKEVTE